MPSWPAPRRATGRNRAGAPKPARRPGRSSGTRLLGSGSWWLTPGGGSSASPRVSSRPSASRSA
eukprot:5881697-Lingulodinium_polyedra.AAC.1